MRFKFLFVACLGVFSLLANTTKPVADSNRVENIRENISNKVLKAANVLSELDDTEDPEEIFARAIDSYKTEFDSYLNIIGLNVSSKELITDLEGFDINYVAPSYSDIMYDYQINFENSMSSTDLVGYENFRKANYDLDWSVTLINNKFKDLNITTKYNHTDTGSIITTPVVNPGSGIGTGGTVKRAAASIAIGSILAGAGLGEAVISAFSACIASLQVALGSSWIPFVGWIIAVGIAVGALIALTVSIVQNWDAICSVIEDIKAYFLNAFSKFANLIETYFSDAVAKGEESRVAKKINIDGKEYDFIDTEITSKILSDITDDCQRNKNVWLLGHIGDPRDEKGKHWWIAYDKVEEDTVIRNKLYDLGVCTYTWYNNTAKRMMANGSITINGNYNLLIYDKTVDQNDLYGWNHYHLGVKQGTEVARNEVIPYKWAHSFFGVLRIYENGSYTSYPKNP